MRDIEHPEIGWIERTGYPSWLQESDDCDCDCDCDDNDELEDYYE